MKANELRIGNLIQTKEYKSARRIICFYGSSDVLVDSGYVTFPTDDESEYSLNELEPIPLTEEWLLKFGFEKINETDWQSPSSCYRWDTAREGMQFLTLDDEWLFFSNGEVEYVHQLQNLYFALTGEELTIKP